MEEKFLGSRLKRQGRSGGKLLVRGRGGGNFVKSKYVADGSDNLLLGIPYKVLSIGKKNDKRVGFALYSCGMVGYVYVSDGVKEGDILLNNSGEYLSKMVQFLGSTYTIKDFKVGDKVSFIEGYPGGGYKYCKSYGTYGIIVKKLHGFEGLLVRMRSGVLKFFYDGTRCIFGSVPYFYHKYDYYYKAGEKRLLGYRPRVRGVAMNPVDHPHGGGEGKTSGGRHPVSPWGQLAKGYKTVKKRKSGLTKRLLLK